MKTIAISLLLGCSCILVTGSASQQELSLNGHFEGNEPFWSMEIENNRIILHCVNDTLTDTLQISRKQIHSETYAFKSKQVFGIIRESGKNGCTLDITEEDHPSHEIYFSYKNVTYMGCGNLKLKRILTSLSVNQNNLIKHSAWKTVRQTFRSKDAKEDKTVTIGPDDPVSYIPNLHFKDGNKFVMTDGKRVHDYGYTIRDSVLTYWESDIPKRKERFRIVTANADSLILSRIENWGSGTLILTGMVYLIADLTD